jgi:hypothetical protein
LGKTAKRKKQKSVGKKNEKEGKSTVKKHRERI